MSPIKKPKFLVTGAAGFIGFHFCDWVLSQGYDLVALDNFSGYDDQSLQVAREKELKRRHRKAGDILRINLKEIHKIAIRDDLLIECDDVTHIVHLAARPGVRQSMAKPAMTLSTNIVTHVNMLEFARNLQNLERFVYASSSSVYGNRSGPASYYAASKSACEEISNVAAMNYGIKSTGLRFFTVYGSWGRPDMMPMICARALSEGKEFQCTPGNPMRYFTHVAHVVSAIKNACFMNMDKIEHKTAYVGRQYVFDVRGDDEISVETFAEEIASHLPGTSDLITSAWESQPLNFYDPPRIEPFMPFLDGKKIGHEEGVAEFMNWFKKYYGVESYAVSE